MQSQVADGAFISPSEVVQTALRLLQEQAVLQAMQMADLKQDIQLGLDDLEQGHYTDYATAENLATEIKQLGRQQLSNSHFKTYVLNSVAKTRFPPKFLNDRMRPPANGLELFSSFVSK